MKGRTPCETYGSECRRAVARGGHLPGHLAPRVCPFRKKPATGVAHRRAGEGVACRFFTMNNTYLFIGDHKYWLMEHWDDLEPGGNYVINPARLYRDRRDFVIQPGDTGMPEDYPSNPAR